jgi:hypothetical protein
MQDDSQLGYERLAIGKSKFRASKAFAIHGAPRRFLLPARVAASVCH